MLKKSTMQNPDVLLSSYDFELPAHLIADRPIPGRHNAKLLVYHASTNQVSHRHYYDLPEILPKDHLLVFNQSKVFPCRLLGHKSSGGKCEVFILSLIAKAGLYPVMIKTRGKKTIGDCFQFDELTVEIKCIESDGSFLVQMNLSGEDLLSFLQKRAHIPIPPYIRGGVADEKDLEDYQTVYAKEIGSVAAPTAGLHFTDELLKNLNEAKIKQAYVTLHVGAGTFKPVASENILDHQMHGEYFYIDQENLKLIQAYPQKLIAVGTTSLRVLETCSNKLGQIQAPSEMMSTDIFLYPGKPVHSIAGLITNFHLPKSTLLMLVSALIGREKTLELYDIAIKNNYRFFSYGDGMLILR
jgi:S-adenosylmethionine:tRNA ribosyltransferase-isomerase